MDLGMKDSVAVVCAASRGLGRSIAETLAAEGCDLVICSRHQDLIGDVANDIAERSGRRVVPVAADLSEARGCRRVIDAAAASFGSINALVINTGGPPPGRFEDLDEGDFRDATDLLFTSAIRLTRGALPLLRAGKTTQRSILCCTSTTVREVADHMMLSNSLRAAVTNWAATLARELGPEGIRVNCLAPGLIHTDRVDELIAARAERAECSSDTIAEELRLAIPLRRFGDPREFAALAAFLLSDRAAYCTGATYFCDGGSTRGAI